MCRSRISYDFEHSRPIAESPPSAPLSRNAHCRPFLLDRSAPKYHFLSRSFWCCSKSLVLPRPAASSGDPPFPHWGYGFRFTTKPARCPRESDAQFLGGIEQELPYSSSRGRLSPPESIYIFASSPLALDVASSQIR